MTTLPITCDAVGNILPVEIRALLDVLERGYQRVAVLIHGWYTGSDASLEFFDPLIVGLSARWGEETLLVPLHWPSMIGGDGSAANLMEDLSYFAMERRASYVGHTAALQICADAIDHGPVELHLVGHSFGAIVASAALAALANAHADRPGDAFRLTLLQGALPSDSLEAGQPYGAIQRLYPRVGITISRLDGSLAGPYTLAEHLECRHNCDAMGRTGPTPATRAALKDLLTVLDLSAIHQATPGFGGPGGHHTDLDHAEVFDLIAGPAK